MKCNMHQIAFQKFSGVPLDPRYAMTQGAIKEILLGRGVEIIVTPQLHVH